MFWGPFACEFRIQISLWALNKLVDFKFGASPVGLLGQGARGNASDLSFPISKMGVFQKEMCREIQREGRSGGERKIKQLEHNIQNW